MLRVRCSAGNGSRWLISCLLLSFSILRLAAQTNQAIYTDSLQNAWANWSWSSVLNFNNGSPVHSGSASIAVTITNNYVTNYWGAIYLHHTAFDSTPYTNITFWI